MNRICRVMMAAASMMTALIAAPTSPQARPLPMRRPSNCI